jgi:hypothetical protein
MSKVELMILVCRFALIAVAVKAEDAKPRSLKLSDHATRH